MPRKLCQAFGHAGRGIAVGFARGRNLRIQGACAAVVVTAGVFLGLRDWEWCLMAICVGMVLGAELFNNALEALADEVSPEWRSGIGQAKDMAAGAVLILSCTAAVVALLIFWGRLGSGS